MNPSFKMRSSVRSPFSSGLKTIFEPCNKKLLAFASSVLQGIKKESSFPCDYSLSLRGCALELKVLVHQVMVTV